MKQKVIDDKNLTQFMKEALYTPVNPQLARCIDGRYGVETDLPPVAMPGADGGQLTAIFATANKLGLPLDPDKTFGSLIELVGGKENLQVHTDTHAPEGHYMGGCGHMKNIRQQPDAFGVTPDQVNFIWENLQSAGANETVLPGDHEEEAAVIVKGPYGVRSQRLGEGEPKQVFIFHKDFTDERQKKLAELLVRNGAVQLPAGMTVENFAAALSGTVEEHFTIIGGILAKGKEIFQADVHPNRNVHLVSLGLI